MLIVFVKAGSAFLPEVEAYIKFFTNYGVSCDVISAGSRIPVELDVKWHFMGFDCDNEHDTTCKIHDYASASVPPFRYGKDFLKRRFTAKPSFRLFLNDYVRRQLGFRDDVPFGYRDMGIYPKAINQSVEKKYDFICVGEDRLIDRWISAFTIGQLSGRSLLVLTKSYAERKERLKEHRNIQFAGPVPHHEVAGYISGARFGINFVPDKQPFNFQTSTKFLEYASAGVPILTTDYSWVRDFKKKHGGNYYCVAPDFSNLNWESIINFDYRIPNLADFSWSEQITKSGVLTFLQSRFPDQLGGISK